MKRIALFASAALLLFLAAAQAGGKVSDRYTFDPAHTQLLFTVDHLGFSHPHGRFDKLTGGFTFDPAHPESSTINVTVEAGSIDMNSSAWNDALKGSSFLNTAKYPEITFKSTSIQVTGKDTGRVTGDLTIRGVTRPVTLAVTYNKSGVHPLNKNYIAGFSATGAVMRADFGMNFGLPGVGDKVKLDIEVEGIRQDFDGLSRK
jgi:polyisoprenoid-binding protein YceI